MQQTTDINLDNLIRRCCKLIQSRPIYEDRHSNEEDEGLCGLLRMVCAIVKYNISFKESVDGRVSDGIPSFFLLLCSFHAIWLDFIQLLIVKSLVAVEN